MAVALPVDLIRARSDFAEGGYNFLPAVIRYRTGAAGSENRALPRLTISQGIIQQVM